MDNFLAVKKSISNGDARLWRDSVCIYIFSTSETSTLIFLLVDALMLNLWLCVKVQALRLRLTSLPTDFNLYSEHRPIFISIIQGKLFAFFFIFFKSNNSTGIRIIFRVKRTKNYNLLL